MICNIKGIHDYPHRGRSASGTVVHAAMTSNGGVYMTPCNKHAYFTRYTGFEILKDRPDITCKGCLRVLAALSKERNNTRYVLAHRKANLYYNSAEGWVPDIDTATLYKGTKYIQSIIESFVYYKDDKIIDRWHWENDIRRLQIRGADKSMINSRFRRVRHQEKDYKIIKVVRKIEVIEG